MAKESSWLLQSEGKGKINMHGYFLIWDEELTNHRPGRKYGKKYGIFNSPNYTSDDLVFWFHFYLLFYDALYVPVNFPTDLRCMPEVLERLRIDDPDSTLRSDLQPLRFTWDVSRGWEASVDELDLEELGKSMIREVDVSLREPDNTP